MYFRSVNRRTAPGYRDDWQRHHLLPRQLEHDRQTSAFFATLQKIGFNFDDFETNGILLPATRAASAQSGFPLHAGPHPFYNQCVTKRVLAIARYGESRASSPLQMLVHVRYLQIALRDILKEASETIVIEPPDAAIDTLFARFAVSHETA